MFNTLRHLGTLPLVAFGVVCSLTSPAQAGTDTPLAQSNPTSGSASLRAPVPFARKGPVSTSPTTPDTAPAARRTASGSGDGPDQTDVTSRGDLDRAAAKAAKAAVEADSYHRVTIIGPGSNGAWRAKAYRGDAEVALIVASGGMVTTE